MTSPSFYDRDVALRQMMGPPTAQEHLREAMRRDLDPRWHLLPVEPVKTSPPVWLWVAAVSLSLGASYVIAFVV